MHRFLKRRYLRVAGWLLLISLVIQGLLTDTSSLPKSGINKQESHLPQGEPNNLHRLGPLPLQFEANLGQSDAQALYIAHGSGYNIFLTSSGAVMSLLPAASASGVVTDARPTVLRYELQGARPNLDLIAEDPLPGKSNYFIGNDSQRWHIGVPTYGRVRYKDVYPGIDVAWYGNNGQLEYDFNVAAGADPAQISFKLAGADKVELVNSNLVLHTANGELLQLAPHIYQNTPNGQQEINGGYRLTAKGEIGFSLAAYDHSRPLTIDPALDYSTYLGGSSDEFGDVIAVDSSGAAYIAGLTLSADFPVTNSIQPTNHGNYDVFVSKLAPAGQGLIYSTYLGGSAADTADRLALDQAGDAYVTGSTSSTDFPLQNALQPTYGGGRDAFVAKLNATGSALVYSTYLGGSLDDHGDGIAVDSSGAAYAMGFTQSTDFPTHNPLQPTNHGGYDIYITKFSPDGTQLAYSTYLGGSSDDGDNTAGGDIKVDSAGNAYLAAYTNSPDFPTLNPIQATLHGPRDGFVTKINPQGSALVYSTYLGGSGGDQCYGLAVDAQGDAYVAGNTISSDFPIYHALQQQRISMDDSFVSEINPQGSGFIYSTYLGGTADDIAESIAIDDQGAAYVIGYTSSPDFPTIRALQSYGGGQDAFVTKLSPGGTSLIYSTYLGGSNLEGGTYIAVDQVGNAYVTGGTTSTDFPTVNPLQPTNHGGMDAFVGKISDNPPVTPTDCPNPFVDILSNIFYSAIHSLNCQGVVSGVDNTHYLPTGDTTRAQFARTLALAFAIPTYTPAGQTFTDVPPTYFAYVYIEADAHAGIINGYDQRTCQDNNAVYPCFLPNQPVTRGEIAKMIALAAGYPIYTPPFGIPDFNDVPSSNVFFPFVEIDYAKGIVSGYPGHIYRPDTSIRRDEMASTVYKTLNTLR